MQGREGGLLQGGDLRRAELEEPDGLQQLAHGQGDHVVLYRHQGSIVVHSGNRGLDGEVPEVRILEGKDHC